MTCARNFGRVFEKLSIVSELMKPLIFRYPIVMSFVKIWSVEFDHCYLFEFRHYIDLRFIYILFWTILASISTLRPKAWYSTWKFWHPKDTPFCPKKCVRYVTPLDLQNKKTHSTEPIALFIRHLSPSKNMV